MTKFSARSCWMSIAAIAFALLSPSVNAATVTRATSAFESPDEGTKQVLILKKGQEARVTGDEVSQDGQAWLPVTANGKSGWANAGVLMLSEGDVGYVAPTADTGPKTARLRYWFGIGPTLTTTSEYTYVPTTYGGSTYGGLAFSAGFEALLGKEQRWPLSLRLLFPWISESSPGAQGYGAGGVTRISLLPGFGYAIIPDKLEIVVHAGLSLISGESPNFATKVGTTPGITIAWQLSGTEPHALYQGIELGAFRIEETRGAADFGLSTAACSAVGFIFGETSSDPTCTPGIAPAAYVFTVLYKIGGQR